MSATTGNAEKRAHILLVDDDCLITDLCRKMLLILGHEISIFNSSSKALNAFYSEPARFDLVITDLTMPDLNGVELAGRMTAVRPDLPIVLLTGNLTGYNDAQLAASGIRKTALKPIQKQELTELVTTFLP